MSPQSRWITSARPPKVSSRLPHLQLLSDFCLCRCVLLSLVLCISGIIQYALFCSDFFHLAYVFEIRLYCLKSSLYLFIVKDLLYWGGSRNTPQCCCRARLRVIPRRRKHSSVPTIGMVFWSYCCYHTATGLSPLDWWSPPPWTTSLSPWIPGSAGATLNIYLYVTQRLWVIPSRVRAQALNHMPMLSRPGDNSRALFRFHIWQWSPASHWSSDCFQVGRVFRSWATKTNECPLQNLSIFPSK